MHTGHTFSLIRNYHRTTHAHFTFNIHMIPLHSSFEWTKKYVAPTNVSPYCFPKSTAFQLRRCSSSAPYSGAPCGIVKPPAGSWKSRKASTFTLGRRPAKLGVLLLTVSVPSTLWTGARRPVRRRRHFGFGSQRIRRLRRSERRCFKTCDLVSV